MNTLNLFLRFLIIISTFLLTHCYVPPASIIKLKPKTNQLEWYKGKEIVTLDNDSVIIKISFDRNQNDDYLFDIDIENNSEQTILVKPERFNYKIINGNIKDRDNLKSVYAKDPETEMLELQKTSSIHQSNMATQSAVYSFGYFLQFVGQTKALITNDEELSERLDYQDRRMREDEFINDINNYRISELLENSSYIWEILALRKTTLYPHESISGKVFFPANELAKELKFNFPIEKYELNLLYDQEIVPAEKNINTKKANFD